MKEITKHSGGFPPQYISDSQKTKSWAIKCVQAICNMSSENGTQRRSTRQNKLANYDLLNSVFSEEDFDHVVMPYGAQMKQFGGSPTKMQNLNILRSAIETLRGEEMNTDLDFFVKGIRGDCVTEKQKERNEAIKEAMAAKIRQSLQLDDEIAQISEQTQMIQQQLQTVEDKENLQQLQQELQKLQETRNNMPDMRQVIKNFDSEYVHPLEQTNNFLLKFYIKNDRLPMKFNQGWLHAMTSAEEVYKLSKGRIHPTVRVVNPVNFDFDKGTDTTFIHKGEWAREEFWLPIGEVVDKYGRYLSKTDIKRIENGQCAYTPMSDGTMAGFAYSFDQGQTRSLDVSRTGSGTHVYVMECSWRSYSKVGYLKYLDPKTNTWETVEVDDTYKLSPDLKAQGATLTWEYDTEIWHGVQIGNDIFPIIEPWPTQTGNLPYVGYVYNNVNSVATSMVDLAKPIQYSFIVVWYRLENELAKAKGKKFVMDMAQLPKSMGWDVDKWLYYFENMGVVWINSREEGRKGDPQSVANFNQFSDVDMSLGNVVPQYMEVLNYLEQRLENILGTPPQRRGDIGKNETATGAQTSIARSTNVTRSWYYFHDIVKEEVLGEMLELAKDCYDDEEQVELVLSKYETASLKLNAEEMNGSQMGVFVTDSFEDRVNLEKMENLMNAAVQQGQATLADASRILGRKSMSFIQGQIEKSTKEAQERESEANRSNSEAIQQKTQQEAKDKALDRQLDLQINRETLASQEKIAAMNNATDDTMQSIETLENIKLNAERLALDKSKLAHDISVDKKEQEFKSRELEIKNKEVAIKKTQANKPKTTS